MKLILGKQYREVFVGVSTVIYLKASWGTQYARNIPPALLLVCPHG